MTDAPDPTAPEQGSVREEVVRVRRSPKYGAFAAVGAALGAVAAWLVAQAFAGQHVNEAGQPVDTTPVIGLMIVVGFVAGGALGAVAALTADRALSRRSTTVTAERLVVGEGHVDDTARERAHPLEAPDGGGALRPLD